MSDSFFVGKSAAGLTTSPAFPNYTKIIINIDDDTYVEAGDGDNVLEMSCPWGTQQMAQDILASLSGFEYAPYDTEWAKVNPAVELGDGVTINGMFSGIYSTETTFSRMMATRISAPQGNDVDHEYPYESKTDRKITRQLAETRASLKVNANSIAAEVYAREASEAEMRATLELYSNEIAARVTQSGGDSNSFGWSLTADGFTLSSSGKQVFSASESGVEITGKITATSGFIGNGTNGFTIDSTAIYNQLSSLYGTVNGVYIGTDGIALGGGRFRVDSSGQLYATSGTFTGAVYANQIQTGGSAGSIQGSQIGSGTITNANVNSYLNSGVANGYYASDVFSGAATADFLYVNESKVNNDSFFINGKKVNRMTGTDGNGNKMYYFGYF